MSLAKKKGNTGMHYKNAVKTHKNFMYQDLKRSHCYDCDFTGSNFDFASFRGAHFKSCNFFGASFKAAEFVGSNLKKSRFKKAHLEDALFEGVNLDATDFEGAVFKNVIFVGCDVSKAKNLNVVSVNIKIYDEMPTLEMSVELQEAIAEALENPYIKASRVLDVKDGGINTISIMRLLVHYTEENLIIGLKQMKNEISNDFCTLSYIMKFLGKIENL
ncbi:MAG: pentapeptide repeat-containing protein [Cellulosilyticaceae bacterium]